MFRPDPQIVAVVKNDDLFLPAPTDINTCPGLSAQPYQFSQVVVVFLISAQATSVRPQGIYLDVIESWFENMLDKEGDKRSAPADNLIQFSRIPANDDFPPGEERQQIGKDEIGGNQCIKKNLDLVENAPQKVDVALAQKGQALPEAAVDHLADFPDSGHVFPAEGVEIRRVDYFVREKTFHPPLFQFHLGIDGKGQYDVFNSPTEPGNILRAQRASEDYVSLILSRQGLWKGMLRTHYDDRSS